VLRKDRRCAPFWVQFKPLHTVHLCSILILFSYVYLRLLSCLFPLNFPLEYYMDFSSPSVRATRSAHPFLFDLITSMISIYWRIQIMFSLLTQVVFCRVDWIELAYVSFSGMPQWKCWRILGLIIVWNFLNRLITVAFSVPLSHFHFFKLTSCTDTDLATPGTLD
jgi:hypothetical protein